MNRYSFYLIFSLFILLSAGACRTIQLSLYVLQPADTVLPASIQSVSVIPMPGVTATIKIDSQYSRIPLDSYNLRMGIINGIYSILSESPRFSRTVLTDTNVAWFVHNPEIHWEDLQDVCRHDTTNTVLLLSKATCNELQQVDSPFDVSFLFYFINETHWLFCNPETQQTLARFTFTDTILVPAGVQFEKGQLIYNVNYLTGETCGKRLVPNWIDVNRLIYTGPGRDLRDAALLAEENKWRNAGLLWNDLVTHRKVRIASRASFNLALAFEREDDLEQAWLWLMYSDSLKSTNLSSAYTKILRNRLKENTELNRQMAGN